MLLFFSQLFYIELTLINTPFTPFKANGDVNYDIIPEYAALLQRNGLKGVFVNGSSG